MTAVHPGTIGMSAVSERVGAWWMPDGVQPEQADLLVEQARMMLGEDRRLLRRARSP